LPRNSCHPGLTNYFLDIPIISGFPSLKKLSPEFLTISFSSFLKLYDQLTNVFYAQYFNFGSSLWFLKPHLKFSMLILRTIFAFSI